MQPEWMQPEPRAPPEQAWRQPELPEPEQPEPSVLQVPESAQPDGMLPVLRDVLQVQLRGRRTLQRRHPGKRREASSRRGPQWWKRRSERIRPIPAVWLLHLWK
ncbi:hypothetical protein Pure05_09750 [Paenarthrobacter ureafaciens]|nr:hypothetical protein Pure01_04080 [Paenarthrobacter ureafaciens]GLU62728.1 hypothetical protein Pure02_09780 [Paenarthrobacter ureafaciens]GLU66784.1 hypothetical protein Pure03_07600 [Paenarthrobacter ureafaciens]GLU70914.1 hypothetical protein Pure04_06290 [Paenarthrobacter ureafaciens]GLU75535.1 hypothetical protein Pure05_09750 [Paenarthrobacter ureafaciens]